LLKRGKGVDAGAKGSGKHERRKRSKIRINDIPVRKGEHRPFGRALLAESDKILIFFTGAQTAYVSKKGGDAGVRQSI